ncbi:hypothetical protein F5H01DRAFT_357145 [Linnemannia elongata]|nr:hypothetical protein F5H01DRAFT_357145 [Linnemannia elongata]
MYVVLLANCYEPIDVHNSNELSMSSLCVSVYALFITCLHLICLLPLALSVVIFPSSQLVHPLSLSLSLSLFVSCLSFR